MERNTTITSRLQQLRTGLFRERAAAAESLILPRTHREGVSALCHALRYDTHETVRLAAATSLRRLRQPEVVSSLHAALSDPSPTVRQRAAEILIGWGEAVELPAEPDPQPAVPLEKLFQAAVAGDTAALEAIWQRLRWCAANCPPPLLHASVTDLIHYRHSRSPILQSLRAIASFLGQHGEGRSLPHLCAALELLPVERSVESLLLAAIGEITGRHSGSEFQRTCDFLRDHALAVVHSRPYERTLRLLEDRLGSTLPIPASIADPDLKSLPVPVRPEAEPSTPSPAIGHTPPSFSRTLPLMACHDPLLPLQVLQTGWFVFMTRQVMHGSHWIVHFVAALVGAVILIAAVKNLCHKVTRYRILVERQEVRVERHLGPFRGTRCIPVPLGYRVRIGKSRFYRAYLALTGPSGTPVRLVDGFPADVLQRLAAELNAYLEQRDADLWIASTETLLSSPPLEAMREGKQTQEIAPRHP